MDEGGVRHPNRHWNNISRYYGFPGSENYENCEGQTDRMIDILNAEKYDNRWNIGVESNHDIKPWWYPGHNWIRASSDDVNDPRLWFDPRAGTHGSGCCKECW